MSPGRDGGAQRRGHGIQNPARPHKAGDALRFIPLGGCGEVTRSMYIYEYRDDIVIVDMGLQFPEEDMPGIDYLIPNTTYLAERIKNIRGVIITHGHYDHIGAIPHLIGKLGNPVIYTTELTRGIILKRQEDFRHAPQPRIETVTADSRIKLGSFDIEFFHVNHNIPGCIGIVLTTPAGTAVHTGDYKFDHSPVNEKPADVSRLAEIGSRGILMLASDSTDAEVPGHQLSENEIKKNLEIIFEEARGRIIVATFSSLLTRIQHLISLAEKYGRKVLIEGYSMKQNVLVARELGYLKMNKETFIAAEGLDDYPDEKIVIIGTGAQGEDRAVLMRIANNEHRTIKIKPNDSIVFSSSVIPGNESAVQRLKDILYKKARKIYHYASMDIHAGGHAKQEELKMMINLIRPKYFIPIHGNYFMLRLHQDLAVSTGIPEKNAIVAEDGDIIEMSAKGGRKLTEKAPVSYVFVDGLGVGDVSEIVLRDRQMMSEDGMFVVIAVVDTTTGKVRGSPDIISRGFVYLKESKDLLRDVRRRVIDIVDKAANPGEKINWVHMRNVIREKVGQFLFQKTQRRPIVLPVVIEV
ncbi:MAG: ribonuclease J [Patescibacteria group bacterium]|nr:ribonuclease J [Patescibacteria group bacterium]